jgi:hypothetical protein
LSEGERTIRRKKSGSVPYLPAALAVAALAFIGLMTLLPSGNYEPTPAFCIICGSLGGVDFTLNVVLFVPLGLALRWLTGRWTTTVVVAALTTLAVETMQWRFIPGRDASLGDLIANTLGAMVGAWIAARGGTILHAPPAQARAVAAALGVATSFIITLSAILLRPIDPVGAQYVQWTPERPNMDLFRGNLVAVQLNGRWLRPREAFPSQWVYDSLTRAMAVRAIVRTPIPPSERQAIIITIANERYEGFMLAQRREGVVFRSTMSATQLKLRPILIGLERALATTDTDPVVLHGTSTPGFISVGREQNSATVTATLRRTVGLAWAMLLPWDRALNARWWPVNAIWLAALLFPVSFLTMRSRRVHGAHANPVFGHWPLGLVLGTLVAAPALFRLSFLSPGEWVGAVTGVAAGVLVERTLARSVSQRASGEVLP